ncbi:Cytochrome P450 E-class CYP52 [Penicillium cataractarum]|uniref:Cytochrome P450 E-class CYP52 n=1 Tax=Penicillium cataractarum TaxID=2100454 RepID=A0A9W9RZM6_9EURO|nr:Cytochrome P450 E-class CYP52 [Penicillium cataractarum]KAJ5369337.1 Cytochrome P450 E-class CYP52 [Penicillium cataractarum]
MYIFVLARTAAAVVIQILRMMLASWHHSRKARALGYGTLPLFPCNDVVGIDTLKQSPVADKKKLLPELSTRRIEIMSEQEGRYVTIYMLRNLDRDLVFTIDPKNV